MPPRFPVDPRSLKGVLDVKDSRGRRYRLEPANVMKVAASGAGFVVEESTAEDIAAVSATTTGASDASKPVSEEHSVE